MVLQVQVPWEAIENISTSNKIRENLGWLDVLIPLTQLHSEHNMQYKHIFALSWLLGESPDILKHFMCKISS